MRQRLRMACCVGWLPALVSLGLTGCGALDEATDEPASLAQALATRPDGKGGGTRLAPPVDPPTGTASLGNGISYYGGPIMTGTIKIYYIWYGNWTNNTAQPILTDLAGSFGGSSYFNINSTYDDNQGRRVADSVVYGGSTTDAYSHGKVLNDGAIWMIVSNAIATKRLPLDAQGVYFVLTSSDVAESSGFCSQYCGWHGSASLSGASVKYAFVGNAERCPAACSAQASSPNANVGADAMASIIAHELSETVTDPELNAWHDSSGEENADKCAWKFGTSHSVANGSRANVHLGNRDYYLQEIWLNAHGGSCALAYGRSTPGPALAVSNACTGASDSFSCAASASGGSGPYTFSWTGIASKLDQADSGATSTTDWRCQSSTHWTVTVTVRDSTGASVMKAARATCP